MRNFLLPPLHSPPLRSLHRFHSPFSVPPSPSWTALPRRRTGSPRSISFQLRANRGFRGQASMVHRLFVATFPLATGYFIISLRCGKLTPLAVHPFFNDCSQRCFGFFFFPHSLEPCELILAWKELVFVNYKSSKNDYFSNSNLRKLIDATFWNNVIVRYIENIKI